MKTWFNIIFERNLFQIQLDCKQNDIAGGQWPFNCIYDTLQAAG